jgi:hypothetical protein
MARVLPLFIALFAWIYVAMSESDARVTLASFADPEMEGGRLAAPFGEQVIQPP